MRVDIFDQTIELGKNRSIVLHEARNAEIVCIRGHIWITEDPLRNDIGLAEGKSHVIGVDGLAFVTALTPSAVWLREPAATVTALRNGGWLPALTAAVRGLVARLRGSAGQAAA